MAEPPRRGRMPRRWHYLERHIRVWRDMPAYDPRKAARVMYALYCEVRLLDPQAARMIAE